MIEIPTNLIQYILTVSEQKDSGVVVFCCLQIQPQIQKT